MPDTEELIRALTELDTATLEDVINTTFERRRDPVRPERPGPEEGPEAFARWLAQRHLDTDTSIERVVYLPAGAPAGEIRLLEVNRFLHPPDKDAIEPLEFSSGVEDLPFRVFVADITRDEWEQVQRSPELLARIGWQWQGHEVYTRG